MPGGLMEPGENRWMLLLGRVIGFVYQLFTRKGE